MNRIEKVLLENFQSHENTVLEFYEGLNVIIGPSDQGKSAVLRAIKWVLFNEPRGIDFIRTGASKARVEITFSNQHKIIRERSKTKNRYHILFPDGSMKTFEGFGNEVPQEIIEVHGIKRVKLDRDTTAILSMAEQLEGPFLLSASGSTRAKAIGRLVGTHIIDRAIRDSVADLRRNNQIAERIELETGDIEEKLEAFEDLNSVEGRLNQAENLLKTMETTSYQLKKLMSIDDSLRKISLAEAKIQKAIAAYEPLHELDQSITVLLSLTEKWNKIETLAKKLQSLNQELYKVNEVIQKTGTLDMGLKVMGETDRKVTKLEYILSCWEKLQRVAREIHREEELMKRNKVEADRLLQQYGQVLAKLGVCPVCRSEITWEKVEAIITQYREAH